MTSSAPYISMQCKSSKKRLQKGAGHIGPNLPHHVGEPIYTEHSGALLHWDTIGVVMFIIFIIFLVTAKERKLMGCAILIHFKNIDFDAYWRLAGSWLRSLNS